MNGATVFAASTRISTRLCAPTVTCAVRTAIRITNTKALIRIARLYAFSTRKCGALGYQLFRAKKFDDAIRIFQLNIEAYPKSANTYDSLGEAYMDAGDKPQAIANYEKSLQLNPKNTNGVRMLEKLTAP